jgi:cytochrome c5
MRNNHLLIIALVLIAFGLLGLFATTWMGSYPDMITDGMMGQGMMSRHQRNEMMQRMMPGMLPPGVKAADLPDPDSKGAELLARYCNQCHYLPSPRMHTAKEWLPVADRMFNRMRMMSGMMGIENPSPEERQIIVAYLMAHSLKSVSPEILPEPESKGAVLFKQVCSQCHSLPDPKLHTSAEWPKVVERMRSNMQAMGRRVITEAEENGIIAYLRAHARK